MKKSIITLVLVCMALIHSAKAQQTKDLTLEGAKGKLAATLQTPKIENGKKVRMVIICHGLVAIKIVRYCAPLPTNCKRQVSLVSVLILTAVAKAKDVFKI